MGVNLWHFVCGYANITLSGSAIDRFIRICCSRNICLHRLSRSHDSISFMADHSAVADLHQIADKCHLVTVSQSIQGLPVLYKSVIQRLGVVFGLLGAIVIFFIGTSFVLKVEIKGNDMVSSADLVEFLEAQGIYVGCVKYGFQNEHISNALLLTDPRISWAEFDISGTVATLTVSEFDYIHGRPDYEIADVVAVRDGFIVGLTCLAGNPVVSVGQAVTEGQLLVSHFISDKEIGVTSADAVVMAIVWDYYDQDVPAGTDSDSVWQMLYRRISSDREGMNYSIVSHSVTKGIELDRYTVVVESTVNIAERKYIEETIIYDGDIEDIY